jgi:ATP-binding cassette subfamily B protein
MMSSQNVLLHSKAIRLTVARLDTMRLARRAGPLLVTADLVVNLIAGALPVVFTIAAAVVVGRVPAAVRGGLHSSAWNALLIAFVFAAVAFIGQQLAAPVREAAGQVLARRIDGRIIDGLMAASTSTEGIGPLEDPLVAGDLRTAARELEESLHSPGQACAGQLALLARYTQLTGYVLVVGAAFSWLAAVGLLSTVLLFRYGLRGGFRKYAEKRFAIGSVEQRSRYLRGLAIDVGAAKEIRIFGLIGWFRDYWRMSYLEWLRPLQAARRRIFLRPFAGFMAWGMAVSVSILALLGASAATADGKLSLTRYILVITSVLGTLNLGEFYRECDMATAVGMRAYGSARRFLGRLAVAEGGIRAPADTPLHGERPVPIPAAWPAPRFRHRSRASISTVSASAIPVKAG